MKIIDILLCEMANCYNTGIPEIKCVWVSTKMASHGPRVKIFFPDPTMDATIRFNDKGEIKWAAGCEIDGKLYKSIRKWIELNLTSLLKVWNSEIDYQEFDKIMIKV